MCKKNIVKGVFMKKFIKIIPILSILFLNGCDTSIHI